MSGDAHDFNNIETRAVKLFFPARQGNPEETGLFGLPCLDHPPYSPDLALLDYRLFPGLKKQLKGRHFLSNTWVIAAAETWLDGQTSEFFEWLAEVRAKG